MMGRVCGIYKGCDGEMWRKLAHLEDLVDLKQIE
jgi:hypothetical protein